MDPLIPALVTALGVVAGALGYVYRDMRKAEAKRISEAEERAVKLRNAEKETQASIEKMAQVFADSIASLTKQHQTQETDIHIGHQKLIDEWVRDHRKELSGMVDRVLHTDENEKKHQREREDRMNDLLAALERNVREKSGSGGTRR